MKGLRSRCLGSVHIGPTSSSMRVWLVCIVHKRPTNWGRVALGCFNAAAMLWLLWLLLGEFSRQA